MLKKIVLSSVVASTLLVQNASSDFLGAEAGVALWGSGLSGDIKKGNSTVDFEKDLGYDGTGANMFAWAYFDHPVPLIPNIKVQYTKFEDDASGTINSAFDFAGKTYNTGDKFTTSLTFNQIDLIPYWRILDNWVNFDIGLDIKQIDGNIKIDSSSAKTDTDFSKILPLLYAKARFDMPFTGLSVEADVSYIGFNGTSFQDMKGGIVYQTSLGLGATIGYRKQSVTLDNIDGIYSNMDIDGVYAGVFFHF